MRRSVEYRAFRKAGIGLCRRYRERIRECDRIIAEVCRDRQERWKWRGYRADWTRRLNVERRLLAALRSPGGVHAWRLTVIELRPRGTARMLCDTGVDIPSGGVTLRHGRTN